jgi:hypothetical protein
MDTMPTYCPEWQVEHAAVVDEWANIAPLNEA